MSPAFKVIIVKATVCRALKSLSCKKVWMNCNPRHLGFMTAACLEHRFGKDLDVSTRVI